MIIAVVVVVVAVFSVFNISGALLPLSCRHEDRKVERERGGGELEKEEEVNSEEKATTKRLELASKIYLKIQFVESQ